MTTHLGFEINTVGHGEGLDKLAATNVHLLGSTPSLRPGEAVGPNCLSWINLRAVLENPSAHQEIYNAIAWMRPSLPTTEDDEALWNPKNPKDFTRHTMLPHYIVAGGNHPVAFYLHLQPNDGDPKWTLQSISRPFLKKARAENASPVEE